MTLLFGFLLILIEPFPYLQLLVIISLPLELEIEEKVTLLSHNLPKRIPLQHPTLHNINILQHTRVILDHNLTHLYDPILTETKYPLLITHHIRVLCSLPHVVQQHILLEYFLDDHYLVLQADHEGVLVVEYGGGRQDAGLLDLPVLDLEGLGLGEDPELLLELFDHYGLGGGVGVRFLGDVEVVDGGLLLQGLCGSSDVPFDYLAGRGLGVGAEGEGYLLGYLVVRAI